MAAAIAVIIALLVVSVVMSAVSETIVAIIKVFAPGLSLFYFDLETVRQLHAANGCD